MRAIRKSDFNEIYLEILRHERHAVIGFFGSLPDEFDELTSSSADITDSDENNKRLLILRGYRGPLIDRLPKDVQWSEATMSPDDYADLFVVAASGWEYFSRHTGRLEDAAKVFASTDLRERLRKGIQGKTLYDGRDANNWIDEQIANISKYEVPGIINGTLNYRLVLMRDSSGRVAIIEGNHRAVAVYAIQILQKTIELMPHSVFLGTSGSPCCWNWS